MFKNIFIKLKKLVLEIKQEKNKYTFIPIYRVIEILEEEGEYTACIQLIGKNITFYERPEIILADDALVDQFSPRDIRTLTYLGYLCINSPKYKILARRMIEDNKMVFAIKKKGEKEAIFKTAKEILKEQEIVKSMSPNDAKIVGYTAATEIFTEEEYEKMQLLKIK